MESELMVCCMGVEPADGLLWLMCGGNKTD